jgi:ubiquitin carboxyl-terminal hydrolase 5/13
LTCFGGYCRDSFYNGKSHAEWHTLKSGHVHYAIIRKTPKPVDPEAKQPSKVAIGVAGGAVEEEFDFRATWWCQACDEEVDNAPDIINVLLGHVLRSDSAFKGEKLASWEAERNPCVHVIQLDQSLALNAPVAEKGSAKCSACDISQSLWVCLSCGALGCSRRVFDGSGGNNHAVAHFESTKHPLVVKTGSVDADGSCDVHCYACDEEVADPMIAKHLKGVGIDINAAVKTEASLAEMELQRNLNLNFDNFEDGNLQMVTGLGKVGLRNLGNTCYMASALQVLVRIPSFASRYREGLIDHFSTCGRQPESCVYCQMHRLVMGLTGVDWTNGISLPPEGLSVALLRTCMMANTVWGSFRQQDSAEWTGWFLDALETFEKGEGSPFPHLKMFDMTTTSVMTCSSCGGSYVKNESDRSLTLPLCVQNGTSKLSDMLERYSAPSSIIAYCSRCTKALEFIQHRSISVFPDYLWLNVSRFTFTDWVPKKDLTPVTVPSVVDLDGLRTNFAVVDAVDILTGDERQEEQSAQPAYETEVASLSVMGFDPALCLAALRQVGGSMDQAMELILTNPGAIALEESSSNKYGNPEAVSETCRTMLMDMGFTEIQATNGLMAAHNDVERAISWVMDHPEESMRPVPAAEAGKTSNAQDAQVSRDILPANYELVGVVTHKGASTSMGHYDCLCRSPEGWLYINDNKVAIHADPPLEGGYMFFFRRILPQ